MQTILLRNSLEDPSTTFLQVNGTEDQRANGGRTGELYASVNSVGCWEHTSSRGRLGSASWGRWGRSWHLIDRLCLFLWAPTKPSEGLSNSSAAIVLWISADHPWPPKHSKAGKRRALAADQQDIFTVKESICYCEAPSISYRMFGNQSGTLLAPRLWDIPLHLIFSLKRRGGSGQRSGRWGTYLCECR